MRVDELRAERAVLRAEAGGGGREQSNAKDNAHRRRGRAALINEIKMESKAKLMTVSR